MRLVLIRHGQARDTAGRCIGRTDVALSPAGLSSIQRLASRWHDGRATLAPPLRVISSDLVRARASAAPLAAAGRLEGEVDARLREVDFGVWDGQWWSDIERDDGARFAAWMDDWTDARPPAGESFSDLRHRVGCWYGELRDAAGIADDATIGVVTHAGVIRALLCHLLDLAPARAFDIRIDPAHVTGLRCQGDRAELLFLNAGAVPMASGATER